MLSPEEYIVNIQLYGPGETGEVVTSEDIESGGNAESENPSDSQAVTGDQGEAQEQ
ncbi:MAG: hypothetical protein SGI87_03835 [Flavobacteriales bacterium]|nr:hypothetical protein [Flavobacteriales bacterium]